MARLSVERLVQSTHSDSLNLIQPRPATDDEQSFESHLRAPLEADAPSRQDSDSGQDAEVARDAGRGSDDIQSSPDDTESRGDESAVKADERADEDEATEQATVDESSGEAEPPIEAEGQEPVVAIPVNPEVVQTAPESDLKSDRTQAASQVVQALSSEVAPAGTEADSEDAAPDPSETPAAELSGSVEEALVGEPVLEEEVASESSRPDRERKPHLRKVTPQKLARAAEREPAFDLRGGVTLEALETALADEGVSSRPPESQPNVSARDAASGDSTVRETSPRPSPPHPLAQQVAGRGPDESTTQDRLNSAQQARLVDRVARALQAAQGRGGRLQLRLHPPELGGLRLEIRVQGNALMAKLEAETTSARAVLLENLPVLRERLEEQGVQVEQFDVDLWDQQADDRRSGMFDARQNHDQSGAGGSAAAAEEPQPEEENLSRSPLDWPGGDDQLDVVV